MKTYRNVALSLVIMLFTVVIGSCLIFNYMLTPVSSSNKKITITIETGSSVNSIAKLLKKNKLIKNEKIFRLYCKINKKDNLKATTYELSSNMGVKKIVDILEKGNKYNPNELSITFKEGINIRAVAKIIAENTNNKEEDVYNLLKDEAYLDEIIPKYWFLSGTIKNKKIYYSLEGYLFPDTYTFINKDVTVKDIFKKMLDKMNEVLTPYKEEISSLNMTPHDFLTLSSIIELEGASSDDRAGVAGVFYNRLNDNWSLGSDVTTYYAEKTDLSERELYATEYASCNDYNTRCNSFIGLPIGPIALISKDSIKSTAEPKESDYYYFVADKNKKTYFHKTSAEQSKTIQTLKQQGLWYEY